MPGVIEKTGRFTMSRKLLTKPEALLYMQLGKTVRHLSWDDPCHEGCVSAWIQNGTIWANNTHHCKDDEWVSINSFKESDKLMTDWYIYE